MRHLIKVMITLGLIFASTFILGKMLGILTVENVRNWLEWAGKIDPAVLFAMVALLLFIDLFVAVPTLTITILAGYFLGFPMGMAAVFIGMLLAALAGYSISQKWGDRLIAILVKDEFKRDELIAAFQKSGPAMIILSRAAPILPEVTACMAGATHMPLRRYFTFFCLSTIPYIAIASYAGSVSSMENPAPAIYAAIFLSCTLWIGWYGYSRIRKRSDNSRFPLSFFPR